MATCTAACYSDFRSLCTAEGSKWGGWERKAHNKMLMKTPSPQIVSVHSVVCVEAFFPSRHGGSRSGSRRSGKWGWKCKEGQVPSPGEKAKEREQKTCLGCFETPCPLGHHGPISRYSSSHPSSRTLWVLSTKPDHVTFTVFSSSLLHSLSTLPAQQRLSASQLVLWCHQTGTTVDIPSEEIP